MTETGNGVNGAIAKMASAAAGVVSTLLDRSVAEHIGEHRHSEASIRVEPDTVAVRTEIPSIGIGFVTRFAKADLATIVGVMVGVAADGGEMDAMQLSIVSETVAQIASAMGEQLASAMGAATENISSSVVNDAGAFPAPPFESYALTLDVEDTVTTQMFVDFDGLAMGKVNDKFAPAPAAAPATAAPAAAPARPAPPANPVAFPAMNPSPIKAAPPGHANLDLVHDVPLQISAVLGQTELSLRDVVALQTGSVFELDKLSTDPIDLYVNNILIARGEVVVVDDKFAVKISELNPTVEKL